jgi:hypothetical protein
MLVLHKQAAHHQIQSDQRYGTHTACLSSFQKLFFGGVNVGQKPG